MKACNKWFFAVQLDFQNNITNSKMQIYVHQYGKLFYQYSNLFKNRDLFNIEI